MATGSTTTIEHFFAHCSDLLFIADRGGALVRTSASLARFLGPRSRDTAKLSECVHPDDRATFQMRWERIDESAQSSPFEFRLLRSDGIFRPVACTARRQPEGGGVDGLLKEAETDDSAIARDMVESQRAEVEIRDKIALILQQQQVIHALATPILEVWDHVLTVPLMGAVDSARAAEVMESLLSQVSLKRAKFAILDLTGVETVDTDTASHLLRLVQAIQLLGAEGIITGIRPRVAQTIVVLGMDLASIVTLTNLRAGLRYCIRRMREGAK